MFDAENIETSLSQYYPELYKLYQDKKFIVDDKYIYIQELPLLFNPKHDDERTIIKKGVEGQTPNFQIKDNKLYIHNTNLEYLDPKNRTEEYLNNIQAGDKTEQLLMWKNNANHYRISCPTNGTYSTYNLMHTHKIPRDKIEDYADSNLQFSLSISKPLYNHSILNYTKSLFLSALPAIANHCIGYDNSFFKNTCTATIFILATSCSYKLFQDFSQNRGKLENENINEKIIKDFVAIPATNNQTNLLKTDLEVTQKLGWVNYNLYNLKNNENCVKFITNKMHSIGINFKELVSGKSFNLRDYFVKTHNFLIADKIKNLGEADVELSIIDKNNKVHKFNLYQTEDAVFYENEKGSKFIPQIKDSGKTKGVLATKEFVFDLLKENGIEVKEGKIFQNNELLKERIEITKKLDVSEDKLINKKPKNILSKFIYSAGVQLSYLLPKI